MLLVVTGCTGQIGGPEQAVALSSETGCTPPPAVERTVAAGKLLFVVGDAQLGQGDEAIRARLAELGFTVTVRRAVATQVADTVGMDLVVISSTSLSTDLGTRLRDISVPVVTWESALFDDFRMTGTVDGSDFGTVADQQELDIVGASHPVAQAAHLTAGRVDVLNGDGELGFGKPAAAAQVIARLSGSSSRAALFAYEAGAPLVGGTHASARRVGTYYSDDSAVRFNDVAWQLFDATMLWASGLPTQGAAAGDVLFVVGDTHLVPADAALRSRLQGLGLTVAVRADRLVSTADTASRKLVLISETVDAASIGTRLRDVAVPVITFEESLFDDMRLTGGTDGTDFGNQSGQTRIDVVSPTHPIAVDAGLGAGPVTVVGQDDSFHFGKPAAGAQVVATLAGNPARATVWTYSTGAQMVGGVAAPARRLGAFLNDGTAGKLNATGFRLFDAMVRWAIGVAPPVSIGAALFVVGDDCLSASDAALRDRLAALGLQVTVKKGSDVKTVDATGKRIVVISSTTLSTDVGTKLRDVAVPVFTWEPALFDDLRFAGATEDTNWGSVANQTKINVVAATHPIAVDAGLGAGLATVVTTADTFRWAKVATTAKVVATLEGQPARAALFTYDTGAAMVGGQAAPARRVGAFFSDDFGTRMNGNGARIFDACVRWAIATPGPTCVPHTEVCNGQDDDCDGQVDEGVTKTFFRDQDGDGFGRASTTQVACSAPAGFVAQGGDCDDGNATRHPGAPELCNQVDDNCSGTVDEGLATQTYFRDADGDGFGNPAQTQVSCAQPAGYVPVTGDCDDAASARHPGAPEVCNLVDDDCDGQIDDGVTTTFYRDVDGDGFGAASPTVKACTRPAGYAAATGDCDDASAARHPGAPEVCNHIDDNCAGGADEGLATQTYYRDVDGDTYGNDAATVVDCQKPVGYAAVGGDCDDAVNARHPGAPELCNGADDNCNHIVDENPTNGQAWYQDHDSDGYGLNSSKVVTCAKPTTGGVDWVSVGNDCNDVLDSVHPNADEQCNGIDDNCNGAIDTDTVWYADFDADGFGDRATVVGNPGCTNPPTGSVVSNSQDCNDRDDHQHPGAAEICNGQDDDCNGAIDDNATDAQEYYSDADGDGYGNAAQPIESCEQPAATSVNDDDCDDTRANVNPASPEIAGNHRDDNCNGLIDE